MPTGQPDHPREPASVTEPVRRNRHSRLPLWLKLVYTAFLAVLVPYYLHAYGPTNFLYFCDVALLMALVALWTEKPLWASMPAVGILLPQSLWCADFLGGLVGRHVTGMSAYMFNPRSRPSRGACRFSTFGFPSWWSSLCGGWDTTAGPLPPGRPWR